MRLKVLKKTRTPPKAGDIFAFQIKKGEFRFGLVVKDDARQAGMTDLRLVYVYQEARPTKTDIPELRKDRLLLPPLLVNQYYWTAGYFEPVGRCEVAAADVFERHCFESPSYDGSSGSSYYNEYGRRLSGRTEPCSFYALTTHRGFGNDVSRALGLPTG